MKIEIDLNDILGDEYGAETLQESVRRQVVDGMTAAVKKGVGERINSAVSETINEEIKQYLNKEMPVLLASLMDAEFTPVSRFGEVSQPTSFRKQLIISITENMQYKKTAYHSDANAFTKAVDAVITSHLETFKADFQKRVDADFTSKALAYATEALKKKLGIV